MKQNQHKITQIPMLSCMRSSPSFNNYRKVSTDQNKCT